MTPHSIEYLILLVVLVAAHYSMHNRYRWIILLLASYGVYASISPIYCVLLMISTLLDYVAAIRIETCRLNLTKRLWLGFSLFVNLSLLFSFKYFIFNQDGPLESSGLQPLSFVIPIGISYYTLQTIGYTIDVYEGRIAAERRFGHFALFVSFFPQLMAGPIEKARYLLPQLNKDSSLRWENVSIGVRLIIVGLFKKIVVADHLGAWIPIVSQGSVNGPWLLVLFFLVALWVLMDFSGYCDIAIGAARLFNIKLSNNFRRPFLAGSLHRFWQKWHVTLHIWFRDYIYIPLLVSKRTKRRKYMALIVVFTLSGLWHGGTTNLLLFGIFHGLLVIIEWSIFHGRFPKSKGKRVMIWLITIAIWCIGVIFFTSNSLSEAVGLFIRLSNFDSDVLSAILPVLDIFIVSLLGLLLIGFLDVINKKELDNPIDTLSSLWFRWCIYYTMIFSILFFGNELSRDFIYLQF